MDVAARRWVVLLGTAIVVVALVASTSGCSDDDPASDRSDAGASTEGATTTAPSKGGSASGGSTTTPTTTVPRPVPVSKPAKRKGSGDCADTTPKAVVKEYLPKLKSSKAADTAAVRRSLVQQLKQLRKAQGGQAGTVPAPVVAAVYAVSKPRTQRSGAYQGCLQSLVKTANR